MNLKAESLQPEYRDWSIAAIRLLQGVVDHDDETAWGLVLSNTSALTDYFARLGLRLVVDEPEGFAFLRQFTDGEMDEDYERLPKLFRRTRLSYDATVLCVILREELRRFEDEDLDNDRCVVQIESLFDHWRTFQSTSSDEVRSRRTLGTALKKLEELGFVRFFSQEPEEWEIRRVLKARVTAADLESLREQFQAASEDAVAPPEQKQSPGTSAQSPLREV